ncbi:hypothetical protein ADUPG1_010527 [Aduncisulcus paluster]|uniref:Uncharacterized protein n=1 Tax=Aduncisulcus paluster TaxID=2918883 RepID=A0ABQ5JRR6_9EUKA|nr:hypothetical protein ADUPG1_010527 [Aduncisulcus paluster]
MQISGHASALDTSIESAVLGVFQSSISIPSPFSLLFPPQLCAKLSDEQLFRALLSLSLPFPFGIIFNPSFSSRDDTLLSSKYEVSPISLGTFIRVITSLSSMCLFICLSGIGNMKRSSRVASEDDKRMYKDLSRKSVFNARTVREVLRDDVNSLLTYVNKLGETFGADEILSRAKEMGVEISPCQHSKGEDSGHGSSSKVKVNLSTSRVFSRLVFIPRCVARVKDCINQTILSGEKWYISGSNEAVFVKNLNNVLDMIIISMKKLEEVIENVITHSWLELEE